MNTTETKEIVKNTTQEIVRELNFPDSPLEDVNLKIETVLTTCAAH